jgi:hypothetical protein
MAKSDYKEFKVRKMKKHVINLRVNEYEIFQLFNLRFRRNEVSNTQNF